MVSVLKIGVDKAVVHLGVKGVVYFDGTIRVDKVSRR